MILSQPAAGSSLESRLMKYRVAFHSQKHPGKMTMLTCLVRAVKKYCLEHEQKLIAALKVAAAVVYSDRAEVIRSIMTTGRLPDMDDRLKQKKLAELPGMKELMEDPKDEFVDSFEKLIMESLCFVKDVTAQLEISEDAWNRMEGIDRTECEEMIRGEARLYNLCTGWFKGKVICSEYHRFKHLLSWCSDEVKTQYILLIANPLTAETETTLVKKNWSELLKLFRDAWSVLDCKQRMTAQMELNTQVAQQPQKIQSYSMMAQQQRSLIDRQSRSHNESQQKEAFAGD